MSKTWKKVPSERTILDKMFCDLCKKESGSDDWNTENYGVAETEIRLREGVAYPDGGYGTEINIDLCMECFNNILVPLLEKQGVEVEKRKWDW